jgi:hypothetical protein
MYEMYFPNIKTILINKFHILILQLILKKLADSKAKFSLNFYREEIFVSVNI